MSEHGLRWMMLLWDGQERAGDGTGKQDKEEVMMRQIKGCIYKRGMIYEKKGYQQQQQERMRLDTIKPDDANPNPK